MGNLECRRLTVRHSITPTLMGSSIFWAILLYPPGGNTIVEALSKSIFPSVPETFMIRIQGSFPRRSERWEGKLRDYWNDLLKKPPSLPLPLMAPSGSGSLLANAPLLWNLNRWLTPLPPTPEGLLLKCLLAPIPAYEGRLNVNGGKKLAKSTKWMKSHPLFFSVPLSYCSPTQV